MVLPDIREKKTFNKQLIYPNLPPEGSPYRFIHIPKTAGTSVRNWLAKIPNVEIYYGKGQIPLHQRNNLKSKSVIGMHSPAERFNEESIKFTVVRHPYTRLFSAYNYTKNNLNLNEEFRTVSDSFEKFIEEYVYDNNFTETFAPQRIFLVNKLKRQNLCVNHIFKMENLEAKLQEFFGVNHTLPNYNSANTPDEELLEVLRDKRLKKIIDDAYKWDLKHLNYSADPEKMYQFEPLEHNKPY